APRIKGVYNAMKIDGVDIRVFGKPYTYRDRRMAVVLARGRTIEEALEKARKAASYISIE
ncbi:MAG: phosphoribosylglycinamide formyltransferase 2, partial [Ignisphaera sp.]